MMEMEGANKAQHPFRSIFVHTAFGRGCEGSLYHWYDHHITHPMRSLMQDFDRLFYKLDILFDAREAQHQAYQASRYENALILVLGFSPGATAILFCM